MELNLLTLVTLSLMLVAFGMGLGLEVNDFKTVATRPKGLIAGSVGQILLLPAVAVAIASFIDNPIVVVGLLLIAVCPGGSTSNYFTYLARGDVALSISLTAVSGSLAAVTVPLVFNGAAALLLDSSVDVSLPFWRTMRSILLFLVAPVIAGMVTKHFRDAFAGRIQGVVATGGFLVLLPLTPFLIREQFGELYAVAGPAFLACAILIPTMMALAFSISRLLQLPDAQSRALPIEVGVQNIALALFLALTFFEDARYTAVPIAYLILMYVFVPGYVALARKAAIGSRGA